MAWSGLSVPAWFNGPCGSRKCLFRAEISCWDLLTRQYIEPQTQLELNELNNGIASLIISHQNNLIIVGGKDGGVCFIDRDTFEIMKTHKFNSLGTYFKYSFKGGQLSIL